MAPSRWLAIPFSVSLAAVAFASCSSDPVTPTSSSASGSGGAGGASSSEASSAQSSSTGPMPEAGPIPCANHSYTNIPAGGACDLLQQDCGPGKTCREVSTMGKWTTYCAAAPGLKGEGESCYVDDECLSKLHCAAGRCAPVCCTTGNVPCQGGICNLEISVDASGFYYKRTCHYAKKCTLLTKDACQAGFGCHIEDSVQGLATCTPPTSPGSPDLGSCKYLNDCPDMADCTRGGAPTGICHYYCDTALADPQSAAVGLGGCPTGQVCFTDTVGGMSFNFGVPGIGLCGPAGTSSSSSSASSSSASSGSSSSSGSSGSSSSASSGSSGSSSSSSSGGMGGAPPSDGGVEGGALDGG